MNIWRFILLYIILLAVLNIILLLLSSSAAKRRALLKLKPDPWFWGFLYFDPDDPRIMVPGRNPKLGLTPNFAKSICLFIASVIILTIILGAVFWK